MLLLLKELNYDFFSMGSYLNPNQPVEGRRPPIPYKIDNHLISLALRYSKDFLPDPLIDIFDVIIIMHIPEWLGNNFNRMRDKKVVWWSIGQSTPDQEKWLRFYRDNGVKLLRYSSKEDYIPNYAGADAIIKFYKDENEFCGWTGETKQVITVCQSMKQRDQYCNYNTVSQIVAGLPYKLFGTPSKNPDGTIMPDPLWHGELSYDEMKNQLRGSRIYLYTNTYPACYTLNFIEAWMTGIPVVALGSGLSNPKIFGDWNTYQIPDLIKNEVDGFYSDDIGYLREKIQKLLDDYEYAKRIGEAGRKKAIEIFGKEQAKKGWQDFLSKL